MRKWIAVVGAFLGVAAIAGGSVLRHSTSLSVSATSAITGKLPAGEKLLYCTVAVYWRISGDELTAATTADVPLAVGQAVSFFTDVQFNRVAAIRQTADGTCYIWSLN